MIRWQHRMTNKRVVEKAEINEISCKVRRRRWNWLGHVLRREGVNNCFTALGWTPEGRRARGGQRPLGEGLSKEEEARRSGRDGMWPGQRHATGVWADHVTALCPTGPTSDDNDDDDTHRK